MGDSALAPGKLSYSIIEASAALGVGVTNIRREIKAGRIRATRIGRKYIVSRAALEAWLDREPAA
jgi:excisionase family DNA binding protein